MGLTLLEIRRFDFLEHLVQGHFLPHLIETLEIKQTLINTLEDILAPEHIANGSFLGNGFEPDIPIHDHRAISVDVHDK